MTKIHDHRLISDATAKHFGIVETDAGWVYPSPDPVYRRRKAYPDRPDAPKFSWVKGGAPGSDMVYGLDEHKGATSLYLCEGEPDVWTMHEAGIPAVSFMAGAGTPPSETALASLYEAMTGDREVRIVYDRDEAGEKGAHVVRKLLEEHGFAVKVFLVPEQAGNDVSDIWQGEHGNVQMFMAIIDSLEEWEAPVPWEGWTQPLSEWLEQGSPAIEWVVDGLFARRSVVMIAAPFASGKSWFIADLCISVSSGRRFLGHFDVTTSGPTLLCDQDSTEDDQRRRYTNLLRGAAISNGSLANIRVAYFQGIDLMNDEQYERIKATVIQLGCVVVVFDTMAAFHSMNENSAQEMTLFMKRLREIARAGPCVVFNHHMGKPKEGVKLSSRGSTSIPNGTDAALNIAKGHADLANDHIEFNCTWEKPPRFGPPPAAFRFSVTGPSDGPNYVRYEGEALVEDTMINQAEEIITDLISQQLSMKTGAIEKEVTAALGCAKRTVSVALTRLRKSGVIERQGRGVYVLPSARPVLNVIDEHD